MDKQYFDEEIRLLLIDAKNTVRGAKLYGEPIDVENLAELAAALFVMYEYKEHLVPIERDT